MLENDTGTARLEGWSRFAKTPRSRLRPRAAPADDVVLQINNTEHLHVEAKSNPAPEGGAAAGGRGLFRTETLVGSISCVGLVVERLIENTELRRHLDMMKLSKSQYSVAPTTIDPRSQSLLEAISQVNEFVFVMEKDKIGQFLENIYTLGQECLEKATDCLFDHIDTLLRDNKTAQVNRILESVDVDRLPTALMRSFLTITAAAKEWLPSRLQLFKQIELKMRALRGERTTQRLLSRLS